MLGNISCFFHRSIKLLVFPRLSRLSIFNSASLTYDLVFSQVHYEPFQRCTVSIWQTGYRAELFLITNTQTLWRLYGERRHNE